MNDASTRLSLQKHLSLTFPRDALHHSEDIIRGCHMDRYTKVLTSISLASPCVLFLPTAEEFCRGPLELVLPMTPFARWSGLCGVVSVALTDIWKYSPASPLQPPHPLLANG